MNNYKILIFGSLLFAPLLIPIEAQASIYKCVNAKAEVYYNDKPCPLNDKESKIKAVKDPEGGYIPPKFVADPVVNPSKGIVVGSSSEKKANSIGNKKSESSTSNSSNSSSSSSNSSSNNDNSADSSNSDYETASSNSTTNNVNRSKEPVKNVIDHEGYYKDPE